MKMKVDDFVVLECQHLKFQCSRILELRVPKFYGSKSGDSKLSKAKISNFKALKFLDLESRSYWIVKFTAKIRRSKLSRSEILNSKAVKLYDL